MKVGDIIIVLFCLTMVTIAVRSCYQNDERKLALDQCIEDISNKCSRSIGYAIALETENARLNSVLKRCRVSEDR